MTKYKFDCGCEIDLIDEQVKNYDQLPKLNIPYDDMIVDLNYQKGCPLVWEMLGRGKSKGVFQLESNLGQSWSKKVEPNCLEEMSALISLIRPGVLKAMMGDKSMAMHYVDRKAGTDDVEYFHSELEQFLNPSYGILLYQEQSLRIAQGLAGFTESQADTLRKGLGKKQADVVESLKKEFVEGCVRVGKVSREDAIEIFSWIEKGNRYLFNKCVAGDTIIRRANTRGKYIGMSVQEMYKIRNDISYAKKVGKLSTYKQWKLWGNYGGGLSLNDDGRLRRNIIKDIRYMGERTTFRITLEDGSHIDVTDNHKFPTPYGEKRCDKLNVGDSLYKRGGRVRKGEKGYPSYLCKVVSIEKIGTREVFDVEMDAPYHNFVTGSNIVTCNSHGISYGGIGYLTAWTKAHFPLHFYCSWIKYARKKAKSQQEVKDLVKDARSSGVDIYTPTVDSLFANESDVCINIDNVTFGIRSVKSIGDAVVKEFVTKVIDIEKEIGKTIAEMSWIEFIIYLAPIVKKTAIVNLISVGMFDYFNLARQRMLYEYDICKDLTKLELKKIKLIASECDSLPSLLTDFVASKGPANKNRAAKIEQMIMALEKPPYDVDHDDPKWVMAQEMDLLGTNLTFSAIDTVDTPPMANTTCQEFEDGKNTKNMIISGEVISARPYTTRNKQEMGFVSLEDNTGVVDAVVFTQAWEQYKHLFFEGSLIACLGSRSDRDSFLIDKVFEI